jgi:hypothetical protein
MPRRVAVTPRGLVPRRVGCWAGHRTVGHPNRAGCAPRLPSAVPGLVAALLFVLVGSACAPTPTGISGSVADERGTPIAGATVRVKTTEIETTSAADGTFALDPAGLEGVRDGEPLFVTAWATGYYINGAADVRPGSTGVEIVLLAHDDADHPGYAWLPSTLHRGEGENQGCARCHSAAGTNLELSLPVDQWAQDAHARSAANPRFLTMYTGQDVDGNESPPTRYTTTRDYGRVPIPPDPAEPYFGPGYRLDFPSTAGNCAACHLPAAAVDDPYGVDPTSVTGIAAEGIPCDVCHKVWDVALDPGTGLPYPNRPGVLSIEFRRPSEGHQLFTGPLDDVAPGEDTYSPLQRESAFCAPCHHGVFWNVVVYDSFGEWLASPYSDPATGRTCQDCHMPPTGANRFALPDQGGETRDPATIFSHRMPGAADEVLLRNAVTLSAAAERAPDGVRVSVTIDNDQTGHHVPTDSPLRQLILLVRVGNASGRPLPLLDGPVVPDWAGLGDPRDGHYGGLPGQGYAKILAELWTEVSPTAAYWNPTRVVSDNRIPALESDSATWVFAAPGAQAVDVRVELWFRRAFITLAEQKGWADPDILMESVEIRLP